MNKTTLFGRLGRDPELKQAGNTSLLKFSIATTERIKKGDVWSDHTEWHNVIIFGKRGEALAKHLTKGSQVVVEGSLRTSSWEKDGQKHYKTEISASDVHLVSAPREQGQGQGRGQLRSLPLPGVSIVGGGDDGFGGDDIPF
jgi:single-strand DNA-binding protein